MKVARTIPLSLLPALGQALTTNTTTTTNGSSQPVYKNPDAPIESRVSDLLSRMTTQEKMSQLIQGDISNWLNMTRFAEQPYIPYDSAYYNLTGLEWNMADRGGQFYVGYAVDWDVLYQGIKLGQEYLVHNTTLGIPAWVQSEGIHGFLVPNGTIFNSPIAYACSFNPDLVQKMGGAIAQEARALGVNNLFAPLADLARELRFGRVEEGYGEDPHLSGEIAYSYVKGLQDGKVGATVKHYIAFATPEQGGNTAPVHGGRRELLTTYAPSFKRAIIDGGATAVMAAYHSYDGVPAVADKYTLTDLLRTEWGYQYYVMSDAGGTDRLCSAFALCSDDPIDSEAVVSMALPAGCDVEMGGGSYNYQKIPSMISSGKLSQSVLDEAVGRTLRAKFAMGLFEDPWPAVPEAELTSYIHTNETVALARQLDAESIVLLENHNGVLPLKKDANIAVIGPMAHGFMNYGDYIPYLSQYRGVTPLDGIEAASTGKVTYAQGCERWSNSQSGFAEAESVASAADVAVVVVGTWSRDQTELWEGLNATTGEHVDVSSLSLIGAMGPLVRSIINTGTPTVVVYSSGKPITEPWISNSSAALVQQFYPSEQGGNALADVLFGDVNPSGRLSVSFPYDVGTLPVYYDYLKSARVGISDAGMIYDNGSIDFGHFYVTNSPLPLYEFGYGLSYSTFNYLSLSLSQTSVSPSANITVSVTIQNNSTRPGAEVVQIYVKDMISSVVVPNIQLKAFSKVNFTAGETKTVDISLDVSKLGLIDSSYNYVVEPGNFTVYAGRSSLDLPLNATLTVA